MIIQTVLTLPITILLGACGDINNTEDGGVATSSTPSNTESSISGNREDMSRIENVESQIVLPEGANPLSKYDRYYIISGDKFEATYVRRSDGNGSVYVVSSRQEIPAPLDGGCQVVHVSGSLSDPANASAFCNGLA